MKCEKCDSGEIEVMGDGANFEWDVIDVKLCDNCLPTKAHQIMFNIAKRTKGKILQATDAEFKEFRENLGDQNPLTVLFEVNRVVCKCAK